MALDYDELRRIHRLEKNTSKLVEVDEDFYNSLYEFVQTEKDTYLKELKREFSEDTARNFTNLKRIVEELFSLREKKLLNKALVASRTKEVSDTHMALQEKEMFQSLLKLINKHNNLLLEAFNGSRESKLAKKGTKKLEQLSIKVKSNVPSFVGTDMKEYGPFKKGQVVSLPYKVAKLFMDRKLGEINE